MSARSRFLRDKRAVTPVLSNLLLTIVAVAVMSIATTATYVITTNLRENMSERILVEDIWFNKSTSSIDIYIRNIGKVAIYVSNVYINHTSQIFNSPFHLEIGAQDWLKVSYNWNSGNLYYIDIVTNRGTHIASYYKAS